MNGFDIAVLTIIAAWIAISVIYTVKQRKKGGCSGCSGCSGCDRCTSCDKCDKSK